MATPITLDESLHLLQVCVDKMRGMTLRCAIVIVDASGSQMAAARQEGANLLSPDIAFGKAYAAAMFRRSGRELGEAWGPGHPVGSAMVARTGGRFVAAQGSLVLRDGDEVVGAIGVSGARSDQDEEIAQAGVDAFRR
jgi:uncharacterized protein GlcG (DUF336 family)